MKETDLALKFIDYFNDTYEVYKEVPTGYGTIDMVAVSGNIRIGVEVKLMLNFKVIEQAYYNKLYFHYTYVAVPKGKQRHFVYMICRQLNIGVLEYNEKTGEIVEEVSPKLNRKAVKIEFKDYMKQSVAGSQNDRITAFRNTINCIVKSLHRHDGREMKEVLESVTYHWNKLSTAKASLHKWCTKGVIKEFTIKDGKLYLTDYGREYYKKINNYDYF